MKKTIIKLMNFEELFRQIERTPTQFKNKHKNTSKKHNLKNTRKKTQVKTGPGGV